MAGRDAEEVTAGEDTITISLMISCFRAAGTRRPFFYVLCQHRQ